MSYQILEVGLYPANDKFKKIQIPFYPSALNVIYGKSKTGKTALIEIINYCMCSSECMIPSGVIRSCVSYYSITIECGDLKIFIARKSPGIKQKSSSVMYFQFGKVITVPDTIVPNSDVDFVKEKLNEIFGHSRKSFINDDDRNKAYHPTFRTGVNLVIQRQNILTDKNCILDIPLETNDFIRSLQVQNSIGLLDVEEFEIERKLKKLKKNKSELENMKNAHENDKLETESKVRLWINKCIEYGFLEANNYDDKKIDELIEKLKEIVDNKSEFLQAENFIDERIKTNTRLKNELDATNYKILEIRNKLESISALYSQKDNSIDTYKIQLERIEISKWLKTLISSNNNNVFGGYDLSKSIIEELTSETEKLENELKKSEEFFVNLEQEKIKYEKQLQSLSIKLIYLQNELDMSVDKYNNRENGYTLGDKLLFLGKLDAFLEKNTEISKNDYDKKINQLETEINQLENKIVSKDSREEKKKIIETFITKYASNMGAEYSDGNVIFQFDNLNLLLFIDEKFRPLNVVGSGANIVAYHIATILGILEYKQRYSNNYLLPSFAVFDQPSQCFFDSNVSSNDEITETDRSILIKYFEVIKKYISLTSNQIIVVEHADETIWGEDSKVINYKSSDNKKLIPQAWIDSLREENN